MILAIQEIVNAFHTMWGLYPAPAMLVHSSREILAVNKIAERIGIPVGITCSSLNGCDKPCPGCLANKALRHGQGERKAVYSPKTGTFMDGYWVPVAGEKEIYVHFGNDITEYVRPELLTAAKG